MSRRRERVVEGDEEHADGLAYSAGSRLAVVDATQIVIMSFIALSVWPAWHFFLAGRSMKRRGSQPGTAI